MQIIRYVRIKLVNPAGVIVVGGLRLVFGAVAAVYRNTGSRNHPGCMGSPQILCVRQVELIQFPRTYRAFDNEQVGILISNVRFVFINTRSEEERRSKGEKE
jgi:hypothetical protein